MERAIDRSDIKIDVAACIRNTFMGIAVVILAIGAVMYPETVSISNAAQAISRVLAK
jgi:hypothetical protein